MQQARCGPEGREACLVAVAERAHIDAATADTVRRLRARTMGSVSRREVEQILDGNFRVNDEACAALQQAWDCVAQLDCQLCQVRRPEPARNRQMQDMAAELAELLRSKPELEGTLLHAKLCLQETFAADGALNVSWLVEVLDSNIRFRSRAAGLGELLEQFVASARVELRRCGERPGGLAQSSTMPKRWREEFESARKGNDALLRALRQPEAAAAVPPCALEERCDHNWRFMLELVGLLDKVAIAEQESDRPPMDARNLAREMEQLRVELEARLPALLDCKRQILEAEMASTQPDTSLVEAETAAAHEVEHRTWRFLTGWDVDLSNVVATKFAEEMLPHPAAFGEARDPAMRVADVTEYPPVIRVLSYNIFIRAPAPRFTHNVENDKKDARLTRFVGHLPRFDVVLMQEVVGAFSHRRDWLVDRAKELGFRDSLRSTTDVWPQHFFDGGLLMLSRLPLSSMSSLVFDSSMHADRLSAKGALYAKAQCGVAGPYLHLCTTHLQSTPSEEAHLQAQHTRQAQLAQLVLFIRHEASMSDASGEEAGGGRRWPLLLGGSFNVNGRRGAVDATSSNEYDTMCETLRHGLGEMRDLLFDSCGSHPVTYADTHLLTSGEVPAERVLTSPGAYGSEVLKRQRLDYLFFFPHGTQADCCRRALEPVVPATCRVEKFAVDRTKDVGSPVTQLSDHYALEATLAVIEPGQQLVEAEDQRFGRDAEAHDCLVPADSDDVEDTSGGATDLDDAQAMLHNLNEAREWGSGWLVKGPCDGLSSEASHRTDSEDHSNLEDR